MKRNDPNNKESFVRPILESEEETKDKKSPLPTDGEGHYDLDGQSYDEDGVVIASDEISTSDPDAHTTARSDAKKPGGH